MANYTQQLPGVIDYSCTQGGFALELWLKQESTKISSVLIYDVTTAFLCVAHSQTVQKTYGANHRLPLFKATLKRTIAGEIIPILECTTVWHTTCLTVRDKNSAYRRPVITFLIPTHAHLYDQISPGQELHTTDDNGIRPHTAQTRKERTSTEFNLVTAQSTAHEPP